jgi:hypothetical protein
MLAIRRGVAITITISTAHIPFIGSQLVAQSAVRFDLLPGSYLIHYAPAVPEGWCTIERSSDLRGSFVLTFEYGTRSVDGSIMDIEFNSRTGPDFHITGEGGFGFVFAGGTNPNGLPQGFGVLTLSLSINDLQNVPFNPGDLAQIDTSNFPKIQVVLYRSGSIIRRGDCYTLAINAAPSGDEKRRFFRRGDVNGDARWNLSDAVQSLQYLFRAGEEPSCLQALDCDDNGKIEIADAIYLLNYLFLRGLPPSAPFPFCGIDLTDDQLGCLGQESCFNAGESR